MEIGRSNIHPKDELDQIGKGEGLAGDSNCHYVLGLPVEHPMTGSRACQAKLGVAPHTIRSKQVVPDRT